MSTNAKVIPFANDDLKIEEMKEVSYDDSNYQRKLSSMSKNDKGVNYENFVKKQQENMLNSNNDLGSKNLNKKSSSIRSSNSIMKNPLNGGTGGQDPNISIRSKTSISTNTGGDDYLNENVVEDVRVGNMLLNQMKINEYVSNYFALTTLGAGVIEYELATNFDNTNTVDKIRDTLLYVCMISTILLLISIISRYDLVLRWKRSTNQLTKYDNIINTGWYFIALELFMCIFSPYPFLKTYKYREWNSDFGVDVYYEWNHVFLAISFIRFYLPVRLCLVVSNYLSSRAHRLGVLNG